MESEEKKVVKSEKKGNCLELKKPIEIDGKKVSKIAYDFDALKLTDIQAAFKSGGGATDSPQLMEVNSLLHQELFIQAAVKKNPEWDALDLKRLGGVDALRAAVLGRNFVLGSVAGMTD